MLDPTKTTLPKQWASEFAMALRSRDVTGAAIGDALREAEAYCADSGQAPLEAFGPAAAYADSLTDLPTVTGGQTLTTRLAPSALGLFGLLLALPTFDAWRSRCASTASCSSLPRAPTARPATTPTSSSIRSLLRLGPAVPSTC